MSDKPMVVLYQPPKNMQWHHVYKRFWQYLTPPRETELLLANLPKTALCTQYNPQKHRLRAGITAWTLAPYQHPSVQAAIWECKYHGNKRACLLLAQLYRRFLNEHTPGHRWHIVPVPRSYIRRRLVGYDHMYRIARLLCNAAQNCRLERFILRRIFRRPQVGLDMYRRQRNVTGSFFTLPALLHRCPKDAPIALIDDVATTGATLQAAKQALTRAGFKHITVVALAHE